MKKNIFLIIITLLLTGCSARYDIYFSDKNIHDNIEIYEDSTIINNSTEKMNDELNTLFLDWENGHDYYERELYATDKITGYRYKYDFTYDEYDAMSHLRKCYEDFEFTYDNSKVKLVTSDEFLCGTYYPNAKEMVISIESKYEISSSNADEKEGNTHTWIINKENYKEHPIIFEINKNTEAKDLNKRHRITIKEILIFLLFISLIIILIKRKRRDK